MKQGLSQEQIDRKLERIESWKEEWRNKEKILLSLQDTLTEVNHDNLRDIVNDKIHLALNSINVCKYQIKILDSQIKVDKLRKENYKIKAKM